MVCKTIEKGEDAMLGELSRVAPRVSRLGVGRLFSAASQSRTPAAVGYLDYLMQLFPEYELDCMLLSKALGAGSREAGVHPGTGKDKGRDRPGV